MYRNKDTWATVNQLVNEFYTWFLFNIDALPKYDIFLLEISATLFNNLSPDGGGFLVSEVIQVPIRIPLDTNNQWNQRLLMVINVAVEDEKSTRTIKAVVQTMFDSRKYRLSIGNIGETHSIQIYGLGGSFQAEDSNSILSKAM